MMLPQDTNNVESTSRRLEYLQRGGKRTASCSSTSAASRRSSTCCMKSVRLPLAEALQLLVGLKLQWRPDLAAAAGSAGSRAGGISGVSPSACWKTRTPRRHRGSSSGRRSWGWPVHAVPAQAPAGERLRPRQGRTAGGGDGRPPARLPSRRPACRVDGGRERRPLHPLSSGPAVAPGPRHRPRRTCGRRPRPPGGYLGGWWYSLAGPGGSEAVWRIAAARRTRRGSAPATCGDVGGSARDG